jgi:hypothetical protein
LDGDWHAPDDGLSGAELAVHLQSLEEQLLSPEVRANNQAVTRLLTPTFREFGSSGRTFTRDQILEQLPAEDHREITLSDFRVDRLSATAALATYRSHRTTPTGATTSALRSSLWVREPDGHWRLHFHQGTRQT